MPFFSNHVEDEPMPHHLVRDILESPISSDTLHQKLEKKEEEENKNIPYRFTEKTLKF